MNLPFGVIYKDQPDLILTLALYAWLLSGLFSFFVFLLSCEESQVSSHDWKMKLNVVRDPCECRKCSGKKLTLSEIILGLIFIPLVAGLMSFMGPVALIPTMGDGNHKQAWAYVLRMDKKFNFLHLSALALPILALVTLWWI